MKFIGQHIVDLIARFRSLIYLENLESSSDTDILVVDSDGKVTKNTSTISSLNSSISANTTNISSNDTDISTNATNIATNTSNIATNSSDIAALQSSSGSSPAIIDSSGTPTLASGITAAEVRSTIGVDAAGTDNSTNVTLAGSLDYITLSGQEITRNAIDLSQDVTGTLGASKGGTGLGSISTLLNSNTTKSDVGLGNVENTALSTYTGSGGALDNQYITNGAGYTTNTGDITSMAISDGSSTLTVASGDGTFQFFGGEGIDTAVTTLSSNFYKLTISGEDASTSNKGVASFSSDNFAASSGEITIKSGGVDLTDEVTGTLPEGNGGTGVTDVKTIVTRQAFTGNFLDDIGTVKHYIPLVDSPNEQTVVYRHEAAIQAPCDGRVASVTIRLENLNTHSGNANLTIGVESRVAGSSYAGSWTSEETETVVIPDTADHDTVHFQFNNDKHFDSAELFVVSIQSDTDITGTNERFWVTAVVEWDWSTYLGTKGTSTIYSSTP